MGDPVTSKEVGHPKLLAQNTHTQTRFHLFIYFPIHRYYGNWQDEFKEKKSNFLNFYVYILIKINVIEK